MLISVPHLKICRIGPKGWPYPSLYEPWDEFDGRSRTYTLSCRSDVRCRRRIEIPVDDRHALWRRKMELGVVHARVELPIRKTEFDLHSTGIRSQDAGKLSRLRSYLKDHSGGGSVRSGNALTPVCRGR